MQSQKRKSNDSLRERLQRAWRDTGDNLYVLAVAEILVLEGIVDEQVKEIERLDAELKSERMKFDTLIDDCA